MKTLMIILYIIQFSFGLLLGITGIWKITDPKNKYRHFDRLEGWLRLIFAYLLLFFR